MKFAISSILSILNTIYGGFVLSKLWAWFVLPLFPAFPVISWKYGFGIVSISILFQYSSASVGSYLMILEGINEKQREEQATKVAFEGAMLRFVGYTLTLLICGLWATLVL